MSFPIGPVNNQTAVVNGITYVTVLQIMHGLELQQQI
jgi:hypothetical protein